jgi:ABC-type Na+ efflux pump permease subunit
MVGPVFYQELLLGSRRNREYIFRWIYGGWLVLEVLYFAVAEAFNLITFDERLYTPTVCRSFFNVFLAQHLLGLVLATPAFVAGAVTDEKTRGTLQYLLTSDLASIHILLGKLLGRAVQVMTIALVGLPLGCFLGVFGGIEPIGILALLVMSVLVVFGVAALTFLAAVWCRQTRDAVLGVYGVLVALFLAGQYFNGPLRWLDPLHVLEPAFQPGDREQFREVFRRLFFALFAWGGVALLCLALGSWRLRPAYMRQLEAEGRKRKAHWWWPDRAPVDEQPIRWKERHVEGLAPMQSLKRVPRWVGILAIATGTTLSSVLILLSHLAPGVSPKAALGLLVQLELGQLVQVIQPAHDGFLLQGIVAMLFFSLLVGIRCSGSVTGEREQQTWEALLMTPLTSPQLIRGKLWGIMGVSYYYLIAYAVPALVLSVFGKGLAFFYTLIWLGVTVLAMYYVGAAGIWSSVRSKTSWRSLLTTVGWGYLGGFFLFVCTSPAIFIMAVFIWAILTLIDNRFLTNLAPSTGTGFARYLATVAISTCIGLAVIFWVAARFFLGNAQRRIAEQERIRHWAEEPAYRRPRRRIARVRHSR